MVALAKSKGLSWRKRVQVRRFFSNEKKVKRLLGSVEQKGQVIGYSLEEKPVIFKKFIAGKSRAVKLSGKHNNTATMVRQDIVRKIIIEISKQHELALKRGEISAKTYKLTKLKYDYADANVGVMEVVEGIGLDDLRAALYEGINHYSPTYPNTAMNRQKLEKIKSFLEKNPQIDLKLINSIKGELLSNLSYLFMNAKIRSFDLVGVNNVLIRAFDKKSGKLVITLVDQLHPYKRRNVD